MKPWSYNQQQNCSEYRPADEISIHLLNRKHSHCKKPIQRHSFMSLEVTTITELLTCDNSANVPSLLAKIDD